MKKKWTDYLSEDVYVRLCECRTIKADIPELMESKWKTMEYPCTKEEWDELIRWLCKKCVDSIINVWYNVFKSWSYVIGGNIWVTKVEYIL